MSSPALLPTIQIRRATPDDAGVCGQILYDAFADQSQACCVVAEEDGRLVGSNCLDERSRVAGPAAQNRGVGRVLMLSLLDRARKQGFAGGLWTEMNRRAHRYANGSTA